MTDQNRAEDHTTDPDAPTAALTPELVTELVRAQGHDVTVTGFDATRVGTGQMGANFRLDLTFAGNRGDVPASLVAKTAHGPVERRRLAAGSNRSEAAFYRDLAHRVAGRVPAYWGDWAPTDDSDFVLLLEDLAPREQGDQIAGCSVAQARLAAVNLAGLQAPTWDDPWLTEHLVPYDDRQGVDLDSVMPVMVDMFLARFGDRLSDDARSIYAELGDVLGRWFGGRLEPFGLVHGDYRLDNLLFAPDGTDVAAVDWQTLSLGLPVRDLAYLCGTGLTVEDRRAHEDSIVGSYHERIRQLGVEHYDAATCRRDYAYGMVQAPMVTIFGSAVAEVTDRGDEMFVVMAERSTAALVDLGTLDLIP